MDATRVARSPLQRYAAPILALLARGRRATSHALIVLVYEFLVPMIADRLGWHRTARALVDMMGRLLPADAMGEWGQIISAPDPDGWLARLHVRHARQRIAADQERSVVAPDIGTFNPDPMTRIARAPVPVTRARARSSHRRVVRVAAAATSPPAADGPPEPPSDPPRRSALRARRAS